MHDDQQKSEGACMACSCPCDMHKEHTHEDSQGEEEKKVCLACNCPCDEHKEHRH